MKPHKHGVEKLVPLVGCYFCPACSDIVGLFDYGLSLEEATTITKDHMLPALKQNWRNFDALMAQLCSG